jgi:hypothetical protein
MTSAFSEQTMAACSYRGELLGLLAIHLILLSVNKVNPNLLGSVHIYSDCLGALDNKVKNLPLHRIPSKCRHSDVLKNIMIQCTAMTFDHLFSHVPAHQDDREDFENLSRQSQLNFTADFGAKRVLLSQNLDDLLKQQAFPPKAISVWAGKEKMTSDMGSSIRYHAHKHLAREELAAAGVLTVQQFDRVDWEVVHSALMTVPRMFQVWACKQIWGIAATNRELAWWPDTSPLCPSCRQVPEHAATYCTAPMKTAWKHYTPRSLCLING